MLIKHHIHSKSVKKLPVYHKNKLPYVIVRSEFDLFLYNMTNYNHERFLFSIDYTEEYIIL